MHDYLGNLCRRLRFGGWRSPFRLEPSRGPNRFVNACRRVESLEERLLLAGDIVYRVNAGGAEIDTVPVWEGDPGGAPSIYLAGGSSSTQIYSVSSAIDLSDPSVPVGTPEALFQSERWDGSGGSELTWQFPVDPGPYQVRLYFAEIYDGAMAPGARVFDVSIEGQIVLNDYDVYADVGGLTGVVKQFDVTSDTNLDITLVHVAENPTIKAIEILRVGEPDTLGASVPSVDFGGMPVGSQETMAVGLTNLGSSGDPSIEIDPSQATITGPGASRYQVAFSGNSPITLAPGEATTVDVTFSPDVAELESATLSISHSGSNSPFLLPLTGLGVAGTAEALIEIDPGETLEASSTYSTGSFTITNLSPAGQTIESVRFDLSTAILPDQVFDPDGTAGDPVAKDFTPDSGTGATGLANHTFSGSRDGGFDVLEIFFTDFQPGEAFSFSVDVDPTSIQGAPQPGPEFSGKVSGLELIGSTLTVAFTDGSLLTAQPFRIPGSLTGSQAVLRETAPAAPTLEVVGVSSLPATVTAAEQTIRVRGPVGAEATLLIAESALLLDTVPGGGFDIDPFEANKVIRVDQRTGTVGATGYVDFPVTLERSHPDGGIYALSAALVATDGQTGPTASAMLAYDPAPPTGDNSILYRVNAGGSEIAGVPVWEADMGGSPAPYLSAGSSPNETASTTGAIDLTDPSVPAGTPESIFQTERWDGLDGSEMEWDFPVPAGQYEVRLYFAEIYDGAMAPGGRVFDVSIEGNLVLDDYDVFAEVGGMAGVVRNFVVASDTNLDIDLAHVTENPAIKAIEIVRFQGADRLGSSDDRIDFGNARIGGSVSKAIELFNLGSAGDPDIVIDRAAMTISGAAASTFDAEIHAHDEDHGGGADPTLPITLGPGESVTLTATFTPTSDAAVSAVVQIPNSGTASPLTISLSGTGLVDLPIAFGKSTLANESSSLPTSLQFGPDGRLYVAQQYGLIQIYDVVRNGPNDYTVSATES
ncbi:MAG: malectin domain-containing carbohydrate-binding protein, partial [Pirellulales bacterium]